MLRRRKAGRREVQFLSLPHLIRARNTSPYVQSIINNGMPSDLRPVAKDGWCKGVDHRLPFCESANLAPAKT